MKMGAIQGNSSSKKCFHISQDTLVFVRISLYWPQTFLLFRSDSSCGEGEDYQFLNRNRNRHNRRLFRRLNNINHNHLDSQQIIPRQNVRLRSLFDRVNQEIEKYRRELFLDSMHPNLTNPLRSNPQDWSPSPRCSTSAHQRSNSLISIACFAVGRCTSRLWRHVDTLIAGWVLQRLSSRRTADVCHYCAVSIPIPTISTHALAMKKSAISRSDFQLFFFFFVRFASTDAWTMQITVRCAWHRSSSSIATISTSATSSIQLYCRWRGETPRDSSRKPWSDLFRTRLSFGRCKSWRRSLPCRSSSAPLLFPRSRAHCSFTSRDTGWWCGVPSKADAGSLESCSRKTTGKSTPTTEQCSTSGTAFNWVTDARFWVRWEQSASECCEEARRTATTPPTSSSSRTKQFVKIIITQSWICTTAWWRRRSSGSRTSPTTLRPRFSRALAACQISS